MRANWLNRPLGVGLILLGLAAPGLAADSTEPTVRLPSFVVTELPEGLPWQYAKVADVEVLTLSPWQITRDFVESQLRGRLFFPPGFQSERTTPIGIVLFAQKAASVPAIKVQTSEVTERWSRGTKHYTGVMASDDRDALILSANLQGLDEFQLGDSLLVQQVLQDRSPSLPQWLYEGLLGEHGVYWGIGVYRQKNALELPGLLWGTEAETAALRDGHYAAPALIPLGPFFTQPPPDRRSEPGKFRLWASQAGLFVRWRLYGLKGKEHDPAAFWRFAFRAWQQPITEELFREHFKMGYAQASRRMLDYLPIALAGPVDVEVPDVNQPLPEMSAFHLRPATEAEVARLKGNFERMEANRLRADFPELAQKYADAARRTLQRGLKAAGSDPQVRGILGQLEYDTGRPAEARPHLAAAFAAGQAGTRALLALARLRLEEERAKLPAGGKLPAAALERVLTPLFAARARKPAVGDVYQLIAEVWTQSGVAPTRGNLAVLLEGAQYFPEDTALLLRTVELHQQHGYAAEAAAWAERGKQRATDPAVRARFDALLTSPAPAL